MAKCEDYPCCGHTDGLGCGWTYTPEQRAFDMNHVGCDHAAGICDAYEAPEDHDYDHDDLNDNDVPWCYGCDDYATCGEYERDGADREQWETTTPDAVWATDED